MFEELLDIDTLQAVLGKYFKDQGQGMKDIYAQLQIPTKTESVMRKIQTKNTRLDLVNHKFGEVVQAWQEDFVPKGNQKFSPETIILQHLMLDFALSPTKIQQSYLGFMAPESNDPKSALLFNYTMGKIAEQVKYDMERSYYKAKALPIVDGVKSRAIDSFDGLKAKFIQYKNNGSLVPHQVSGALPNPSSANASKETVQYIEEFIKSIPPEERVLIKTLNMSEQTTNIFKEGMSQTYNNFYAQVQLNSNLQGDEAPVPINNSRIMALGLRSHEGSQAMWCTFEGNLVLAEKNIQNSGSFISSIYKNKQILISGNWHIGIGSVDPSRYFHNGQDLV